MQRLTKIEREYRKRRNRSSYDSRDRAKINKGIAHIVVPKALAGRRFDSLMAVIAALAQRQAERETALAKKRLDDAIAVKQAARIARFSTGMTLPAKLFGGPMPR